MKFFYHFIVIFVSLFLCIANGASATLIDLNNGAIRQIRDDATYGDGSVLMWVKDANLSKTTGYDSDGLMTMNAAVAWINSLNSSNYLGYNDWRLPYMNPVNGSSYDFTFSYDGSTDRSFNLKSPCSELSYMFYVELNNIGAYDEYGNSQSGAGLVNSSPFENLQNGPYWASDAGVFGFNTGFQPGFAPSYFGYYVWAVRSDNTTPTPVPEPATILLLSTGLVGIVGTKLKKRST